MQNSTDYTKLLVRMTAQDRQSINRMIQHKRKEFESVIEKGVVAMLNAQEEHERLAEKRSAYLNFLTQRNRQKKEQLQQVTQTTKESISQAPIGMSAAGHLALTAAATAGNVLYDNAEQTRQQKEAEQGLFAAQMLYYIPSQDFDKIGKKVANILSYRYQFLIFRLAAGEEGYIRLANFFVRAMKSYAISRLREHKNNIIRAFINAAIPPLTDTLNYRDWLNVERVGFRTNLSRLGTHKILKLDEVANQIIKRCGPAVRTLLGGHEVYINPHTGHVQHYQPYTLIGALNHALILNVDGHIHAGILPEHRPYAALDGNVKYPMILLGAGECTADLGVNFATQTSSMVLDPMHIEALRRLVPDFFDHQASYEITTPINIENYGAEIRYTEERYECPWNHQREKQWHEKLQAMMTAKVQKEDKDIIESFNQSSKQRAMYDAANQYHLKTLMLDFSTIFQETYAAIASLFHQNAQIESAKQQVAQKAIYCLNVAQEIIYAMQLTQIDDESYLSNIRDLINMAHSGIYASREWAFHEAFKYHMTRFGLSKMCDQLNIIQQAHQTYEICYLTLLGTMEDLPYLKNSHKFLMRETQNHYRKMRHYKNQINEQMRELDKIMDTRQSILQYELQTLPPMQTVQDTYEEVMAEINKCQEPILQDPDDYTQALHQISMVLLEMDLLLTLIEEVEKKDPRNPVEFTEHPRKSLQQLRQEYVENQERFEQFKNKASPLWIRPRIYLQRLHQLNQFLTSLIETRHHLHQIFKSMNYSVQTGHEDLDNSIQSFFQRAYVAMQFYFIYYFNSNTYHPQDHSTLYQKIKNYYINSKIENGQHVDRQYEQLKSITSKLKSDMEIHEIRQITQQVKREKDSIERQILDDIEMTSTGFNQAQRHYRDAELSLNEIHELEQKVDFIRENTADIDYFFFTRTIPIPSNHDILEYFQKKILWILEQITHQQLLTSEELAILNNHFNTELEKFKKTLLDKTPSEKNWIMGIHFLAKTLKSAFQIEFVKWKDALTLEPIKHHLHQIQSHQHQDLHQRSKTQKKAMQCLIKTYQSFLQLDAQRKNFSRENHLSELNAWHYIHSSLTWSARLNLTERKWIDKKLSNQSHLKEIKTRDYKSPQRMFYSFILNLVNQNLINKKLDLNRLRKMEHGMNQLRLLPIDLETPAHEDGIGHEGMIQKTEKFSKTLTAKIMILEKELDQLICYRKILIGQVLKRIFLYEWHTKTFETSTYHQCSLFRPVQETNKLQTLEQGNLSDSAEIHYSIETLENWFESFKPKIRPSLPKSDSGIAEDESPTIESLALITPMAKKTMTVTTSFYGSLNG